MNKLFVYGIFLGEGMRDAFGMTNPNYATVKNYITIGEQIVKAVKVSPKFDTALTGLIVDVNPDYWDKLDALEGGYERVVITTTSNVKAYMYASKRN